MALCQYIVNELIGIDWENIANALRGISMEHLAVKINQNYCQQGNAFCAHFFIVNPLISLSKGIRTPIDRTIVYVNNYIAEEVHNYTIKAPSLMRVSL